MSSSQTLKIKNQQFPSPAAVPTEYPSIYPSTSLHFH